MFRSARFLFVLVFAAGALAAGQEPKKPADTKPAATGADSDVFVIKPPDPPPNQPRFVPPLKASQLDGRRKLDEGTKLQLIQLLDAELVHTRKYLPLGDKSTVINPEGDVTPADNQLFILAQSHGLAAKIGDKVQITNVVFREKSIYFEINGGPKKKSKWYQHITVGGVSAAPMDPNQAQPTGAAFTLQFNKQVPEMTAEELRRLVSPVLDFSIKTAAEVYIDTLPPKIKEAMKNHEVLVGMNKDMVVMAKDRPQQKVREKDAQGKDYEEWIYGRPPQDVVFVRFHGEEVIQVKTAKLNGQIVVKTEKEVDVKDGVANLAALQASQTPQDVRTDAQEQPQVPAHRPTLRREGEQQDPSIRPAPSGATGSSRSDEPEWGSDKKPEDDPPPQDDHKPPLR